MKFNQRRPNPVFSPEYRALVEIVTEARREAGLSQRALAERLTKSASHIAMIERGQRRIDSLELYYLAKALRLDPCRLYALIAAKLDEMAVTRGSDADAAKHPSLGG